MANFEKPAGASVERWTAGLRRQEIVLLEYEYVALYGGDGASRPLSVSANDPSVVSVEEVDPIDSLHRIFKLSGAKLGNAMIEARDDSDLKRIDKQLATRVISDEYRAELEKQRTEIASGADLKRIDKQLATRVISDEYRAELEKQRAEIGSGVVWAFMQCEVISWKPIAKKGPRIGSDGRFPNTYMLPLRKGIALAWTYYERADFRKRFAEIIGKAAAIGGKKRRFLNPDSFWLALNAMILNYADNSYNGLLKSEMAKENPRDWIAGYTNTSNLTDVYIRSKRLEESDKLIGDTIVHESEHVAGLPGDIIAELVSAAFELEFGIQRYM